MNREEIRERLDDELMHHVKVLASLLNTNPEYAVSWRSTFETEVSTLLSFALMIKAIDSSEFNAIGGEAMRWYLHC